MKPSVFLRGLWGDLPAAARIHIWHLQGKRSSWLVHRNTADMWEGQPDVYTAVGIAAKDHGRSQRCPAHLVAGIPGLWLDVDVNGGPNGKTQAAADKAQAMEIACAIAVPTVIVDSGYGLHAWYLLDTGPWFFRGDRQRAADLSERWHEAHRREAGKVGAGIDHAHDLARLLRLPGTINAKGDQRAPVEVLDHRGPRHQLARLEQLVESMPLGARAAISMTGVHLATVPAGGLDPGRLETLLEADDELADVFFGRTGLASMSERDLSLCTRLAPYMDNDDLARFVASHRLHHDPTDRKHLRLDYLRRTIRIARANVRREDEIGQLRLAA